VDRWTTAGKQKAAADRPLRAREHQVRLQLSGRAVSVLDWRDRLVCSKCGGREINMVVTGTKRRHSA
jgi:hypothetical protein